MKPRTRELLRSLCLVAAMAAALPAAAQWAPSSIFVQGGGGADGVEMGSVGVQWPWSWRTAALGGELGAHTELFISLWRARDFDGGRQHFWQLGLVPMLRYRPAAGRSPWFIEAGIGLSVTDQRFDTPDRTFGSRLNFSDNLGFGRNFGQQGRHELSLRLQHTSNAGIKKPNPGLNLLMVRYAAAF